MLNFTRALEHVDNSHRHNYLATTEHAMRLRPAGQGKLDTR